MKTKETLWFIGIMTLCVILTLLVFGIGKALGIPEFQGV